MPRTQIKPDGSMQVFYIETPCPGWSFYDFMQSETFKNLKEKELNGTLSERNPYATAESESRGTTGKRVQDESFIKKADADGGIEFKASEEDIAKIIFDHAVARFGPDQVRLHPKSLDWSIKTKRNAQRAKEDKEG